MIRIQPQLSNRQGREPGKEHTMYEYEDYETEDTESTEDTMQEGLRELIETAEEDSFGIGWEDARVRTFEQAGIMTYNKGLVISLPDGTEFQLTIVQSH